MERILITGGAGFIGSHTADALIARGYRVRILDNLDPQIHGPNKIWPEYLHPAIERMVGDVRSETDLIKALDGVQAVYHFAANTGVGQSMYEIEHYVDTNVRGTALLLEVLMKKKIQLKRLVLSSSRAVYGEGSYSCAEHGEFSLEMRNPQDLDQGLFTVRCPKCHKEAQAIATPEDHPCRPTSVYGWTKLAQEQLCQQMAIAQGLPITILRYFNVYGSRQALNNPYTGIVTIFMKQLKSGIPVRLYEQGFPLRDFIHISDLVRANVAALETSTVPGSVFNIGSGEFTSVSKLANELHQLLSDKGSIEVTKIFRKGDIFACVADALKAQKGLGWRAEMGLRKGLSEFLRWAQGVVLEADRTESANRELQQFGLLKKVV